MVVRAGSICPQSGIRRRTDAAAKGRKQMPKKVNKEIRRLKRTDLQGMLIEKNREVRELKLERDVLIEELRRFQQEYDRIGSADALLGRMGVQAPNGGHTSALEALLNQFESEESSVDIF